MDWNESSIFLQREDLWIRLVQSLNSLLTRRQISWWCCCCGSFSNLFSPSTKSSAFGTHQQRHSVPDIRYSSLQSADDTWLAGERSPRVVRFRDEDAYSYVYRLTFFVFVFICSEKNNVAITYSRQDSETKTVLNTDINTFKNDKKTVVSDQIKSGQSVNKI